MILPSIPIEIYIYINVSDELWSRFFLSFFLFFLFSFFFFLFSTRANFYYSLHTEASINLYQPPIFGIAFFFFLYTWCMLSCVYSIYVFPYQMSVQNSFFFFFFFFFENSRRLDHGLSDPRSKAVNTNENFQHSNEGRHFSRERIEIYLFIYLFIFFRRTI